MKTGKIIQVMGPVVDVEFEDEELPAIRDALEVQNGDKKCIMEVAQHIGNNTVRCIMLAASEGLHRDMEVIATGSGIKTPVGEATLGRLFNHKKSSYYLYRLSNNLILPSIISSILSIYKSTFFNVSILFPSFLSLDSNLVTAPAPEAHTF